MSDLSQVGEDFGYRFEPACAADLPCHRKLTVVLRASPSDQHFDPEKLNCYVVNRQGEIEDLVVFHPWTFLNEYRVIAGHVMLLGRHNTKAEAFTFGGTLHLDDSADQLTAVLESPAPLLALLPENPFLSRLAAQCESLLARREAAWDSQGKPDEYDARLARVEPQALYQASLQALAHALAGGSVFGGPSDKTLEHYLAAEHPASDSPKLEDIL